MEKATRTPKQVGRVVQIALEDIKPNPHQPRTSFTERELNSLAQSIKAVGIIQPLTVRRRGGEYELIAGERRLRAAKIAGLKSAPCVEISTNNSGSAIVSLLENMQRQGLDFFDEARGIEKLITEHKVTQEQAASYLGIAQSTLCNKLRILTLPESVKKKILEHRLTERHARALLKLKSESDMLLIIGEAVEQNLNVNGIETLINQHLSGNPALPRAKKALPVIKDVRVFQNTITKAVKVMRQAGIMADSIKRETEDYIEYIVKIPKKQI